jgi:uncharacterized protein
VKPRSQNYVSSRVFKLNVGFLLTEGPGHSRDSEFDVPAVRVSDDLKLYYIRGPLRLSRTQEGILVQAHLKVGIMGECVRCLDPVEREITIDVEELFNYPKPVDAEFSVGDDGILDLAPLLRAEVLISDSQRVLCRPNCKGLCPECGANWNHESCTCAEDAVDPRFAALKNLIDSKT